LGRLGHFRLESRRCVDRDGQQLQRAPVLVSDFGERAARRNLEHRRDGSRIPRIDGDDELDAVQWLQL
jgi:hypothetical protein